MRAENHEAVWRGVPIRWVNRRAVLYLHDESLRDHGGLAGVRDEGLLDSALARHQHLLHYDSDATLAQLAAAYAVGIARNNPFSDENKRTAFLRLTCSA
jgi:death-on-curing protein